jgi:hypothetical protein
MIPDRIRVIGETAWRGVDSILSNKTVFGKKLWQKFGTEFEVLHLQEQCLMMMNDGLRKIAHR